MGLLTSLYHLSWVVEVTLLAIVRLTFAVRASGWRPALPAAHARRWARTLIHGLDIRITMEGVFPEGGMLVVANHRSYLDILVILAQVEAAFLAKAELKGWPVFGRAAQKGNTVFVDRASKESRRAARQALAERIFQGISVVVFPEGTTSKGPGVLPFKTGIFHMAAGKNIPIVPVSIVYDNPDAAWIGDDFFIPHFLSLFKKTPLTARLIVGPVLRGDDGEMLKFRAFRHIAAQLESAEGGLPN